MYSLVVDKAGLKIHEVQQEPRACGALGWSDGMVTYKMVNHVSGLTTILSSFLDSRPVRDETGLRLESAKGPVDFLVIDRVEKPSRN